MPLDACNLQELGIDPVRYADALALCDQICSAGTLPAISLRLITPRGPAPVQTFGHARLGESSKPVTEKTIYLVASLTKPVLAMGVLRLVEQGKLTLSDRVCDWLPEFAGANKKGITIRHLLTHTSGLPDMLPNNRALRMRQAGLSDFVDGACRVTLDFPCGRGVQYQSMGYALLGEIITRCSGCAYADYLKQEIFTPLGMSDTALGAPEDWYAGEDPRVDRIAEIRVPEEQQQGHDWNWNSRYWRMLGAPWGGMLATVEDLSRLLMMMLGLLDGEKNYGPFSPQTVQAARRNQLGSMRDLPEVDRRTRPWGYGWRLNWPDHSACFSDLLPEETFGHWGATGTLWWADPIHRFGFILLTTEPLGRHRSEHVRISNAFAAAIQSS